jgi:4-amino-4-deoxy-L-arabinose transferase-like glycosyltransferase
VEPGPGEPGAKRWLTALGLICLGALALRVGYVFLLRHPVQLGADAYHYHHSANLLADGKGFIVPITYQLLGTVEQTAQHPPLYTIALAIPSVFGLRSVLDHQLWSCVIGTGTVALAGLVGRRLAGSRAGLIAAGVAALHPNLWLFDGMVVSETLSLFTAGLTLLAAYRFWDRPSLRTVTELGVACALAALTRAEGLLFLPLVLLPLALMRRQIELRRRLALAGAGLAVAGLVLAPWVVHNLTRFHHPVWTTSNSLGLALVQGNCDGPYYGPDIGHYSLACIPPAPGGDGTDDDRYYREVALDYIRANRERLPFVMFTRVARTWGIYEVPRQLALDAFFEKRDHQLSKLGYGLYVTLVAASVPGVVILRRRRILLWPMLAMVVTVTATVAVTYGLTRYRVSAELVPVLLAAVAADAVVSQGHSSGRNGSVDGASPSSSPTTATRSRPEAGSSARAVRVPGAWTTRVPG